MARTIHELRGILTGNGASLERTLRNAAKSTRDMREAWVQAGRDVANAATRITAAVTAMGTVSLRSFAKFEQVMVRVGAVTRTLGTKDFELLNEAAKRAGATTIFTAQQSAEAMEKLGLAGFDTRTVIESLPGVLQLASAAQIDIASSADIAAKTMRAFGFEAKDLTRINDTLVATFTAANTDLLQLKEAIRPVGPLARTLNVSLEETATVLAKLADRGFQGELGGTALRNILARLAGATPAVTKELAKLGIVTTDATGAMRPLFDILEDIEAKGLTGGQVMQLFGARGGPQLAALLAVGTAELRRFHAEIAGKSGITAAIEAANMNTLVGQFDLLTSALEDLFLTTGEKVNPEFRKLVNSMTAFIEANRLEIIHGMVSALRGLGDVLQNVTNWARQSWPQIREMAKAIGSVVGGITQFIAQRPALAAMLAVLKVSSLLGITQALLSLGRAFASLAPLAASAARAVMLWHGTAGVPRLIRSIQTAIGSLILFVEGGTAAITAFNIALTGLAAVVGAGAVLVLVKQFQQLSEAIDGATEAQNRLQRSIDIAAAGDRKRIEAVIESAQGLSPENRAKFLDEQIAKFDEKDLVQLNTMAAAQQRSADELKKKANDAILTNPFAMDEAAEAQRTADMYRRRANQFAAHLEELERMAAEAREQMKLPVPGGAAGGAGAGGGPPDLGGFVDEEAPLMPPGMDGMGAGSGEPGAGGGGKPKTFAEMVAQQVADLEQQKLDAAAKRVAERLTGVAAEEARAAMQERFATARDAIQQMAERFAELTERVPEVSGQMGQFTERVGLIARQFVDGQLSAENFSAAMRNVANAADKAADAARRETLEKERQRMLAPFQGLLQGVAPGAFRQALEARLLALRQAQLDAVMAGAVNRFLQLNGVLPAVTESLQGLDLRFQDAFSALPAAMGQFGGGMQSISPFEALQMIGNFLSSNVGQIELLKNQIQLLQQNLSLVDTFRQRRDILRQIESLQQQIAILSQPQAPLFTGITGSGFFTDPGLQTPQAPVTVSFPNISRITSADARQVVDRISEEQRRRGRKY